MILTVSCNILHLPCPPNSHGLTVIFNSRIASVAIAGVDIVLIVSVILTSLSIIFLPPNILKVKEQVSKHRLYGT